MGGNNYTGDTDEQFDGFQQNWVDKINEFKDDWDWPQAVTDEFILLTATPGTKKMAWDPAYAKYKSGEFTKSEDAAKNLARQSYESGDVKNPADTSIRIFTNRYLRYNPLVTEEQKLAMRLILPDPTKSPAPVETPVNILIQVTGQVVDNAHLHQRSSVTTPGVDYRGLGDGIEAIEVYIAFMPADSKDAPGEKDYVWDGEVTNGYYKRDFAENQEGMIVYYKARKILKGKPKKFGPFCKPWSGRVI